MGLVLNLALPARIPFWEPDEPTARLPSSDLGRALQPRQVPARKKDFEGVDDQGGSVRAKFTVHDSNQTDGTSTESLLRCKESLVYKERCAHEDQVHSDWLEKTYGKRGVYFEFPGTSGWGLGHVLSMAYLLHDVCVRAERACHMKLYDMDLHELFGYHDGRSWGPPSNKSYGDGKSEELPLDEAFNWNDEAAVETLAQQLRNVTGPLVHVTSAYISFESSRPAAAAAAAVGVCVRTRLSQAYDD